MDEDVKSRFDDLDKRFATTEKRLDDIKWFIGGLTGLFTIVFGVIAILGNLNFSSEKTRLHEFEQELKSQVGRGEGTPEIELLGVNGQPLGGQEVPVKIEKYQDPNKDKDKDKDTDKDKDKDKDKDNDQIRMAVPYGLNNSGNALSGPLYLKLYSDDIPLPAESWDEPKFKYEQYYDPKDSSPNEVPGGNYSLNWTAYVYFSQPPPSGKHAVLLKVFYGKGKVARASFWIVISEKVGEAPNTTQH